MPGFGPLPVVFANLPTGTQPLSKFDENFSYLLGALNSAETAFNVMAFGAVGNDLVDDSVAIQACIDAAEAAGGGSVVMPANIYNIGATTIVVPPTVTINADADADLHYLGSGVALRIEGSTSTRRGRVYFLPLIRRLDAVSWNDGADTTSVGLEIVDCYAHTFFVTGVQRFRFGIVMKTEAANCVCNTLNLGRVVNNQTSLLFDASPGFGVNQNIFTGGVMVIDSAFTAVSPRVLIDMPETENNGNSFIGVNLEDSGQEKGIVCFSASNIWLNCRFEGCTDKPGYITFGPTGIGNKIFSGSPEHGAGVLTPPFETWIDDDGFENIYFLNNIISGKWFALDFDSSFPILLGNGAAFPNDAAIGAFGTNRIRLGKPGLTIGTRFSGMLMQDGDPITAGSTIVMRSTWTLTYAAPATITGITGGVFSDITGMGAMMATNGNVTLQHTGAPAAGAGKFVLKAGVDKLLVANTPVVFMFSGGNLYEV